MPKPFQRVHDEALSNFEHGARIDTARLGREQRVVRVFGFECRDDCSGECHSGRRCDCDIQHAQTPSPPARLFDPLASNAVIAPRKPSLWARFKAWFRSEQIYD